MAESKKLAPVNINGQTNKGGEYKQVSLELSGRKVPLKKATVNEVDGPFGGKKPA